jgi:diguanylate cyclase
MLDCDWSSDVCSSDLRTEAETDALTGLANRRRFDEALRTEAREAMQRNQPLCVAMIDIDHFKKFNDTHGHALGDQVLKLVARTISEHCRDGDVAARYGGEEFVLVMPKTGLGSAIEVVERIRLATASKRLTRRGSKESLGGITMSVGVARYQGQEALTNLVERADAALYAAKNAGRNQVKTETDLGKTP